MNGVKVKMMISLEVKIVTSEHVMNSAVNKRIWLLPLFFNTAFARYLKKPVSSKKIDKMVIDKNKTKILIGSSMEVV